MAQHGPERRHDRDLIEAGLNEGAGRFARVRSYGDCSKSCRSITWPRAGSGEGMRAHRPILEAWRALSAVAMIDLTHRMAGNPRHDNTRATPSAMIKTVGLKRCMMIVVHVGMDGLTMCRTGTMTCERQYDRSRA